MNIELQHNNETYSCNLKQPIDISIPLKNGGENPNCFWADPVRIETIRIGDFVGSVKEGGSVNYKKVVITPHGNGTHTECFGHISADPDGEMTNCLKEFHFIAQLITIPLSTKHNGDEFVSFDSFIKVLDNNTPEAIIIRTTPNSPEKLTREYSGKNPPYLDPAITQYMNDHTINHLLVDLPSVDREEDGGALTAHNNFWNMNAEPRKFSTITELIFVNDIINDGIYLLNLQIPSLVLDAVPSKPILYKLDIIKS